jgi:hypothetical protein
MDTIKNVANQVGQAASDTAQAVRIPRRLVNCPDTLRWPR